MAGAVGGMARPGAGCCCCCGGSILGTPWGGGREKRQLHFGSVQMYGAAVVGGGAVEAVAAVVGVGADVASLGAVDGVAVVVGAVVGYGDGLCQGE